MIDNVADKNTAVRRAFRLGPYTTVLAVVWTAIVGVSLVWNLHEAERATREVARTQARAGFEKDVLYRRWNAGHRGVYVPVSESTPPNPNLAHVEEREIETVSGRRLTLINPAYMTRQVHELGWETKGVRGHITSLDPIRPANAPDDWEKRALETFERGEREFSSVEVLDGAAHLRLMRPLMTEKGCLKCHTKQGYKVGDVRGGISVSVPMAPYAAIAREQMTIIGVGHGAFCLLGLAALAFGTRHVQQRVRDRDRAEEELRASQGKLSGMLASVTDHVSMMDKDLNILWANDTAKELFGEELIGKKCYQAYHGRETPCEPYPCLTLKSFEDERTHTHETQVISEDGQTRCFHCTANVALRDENGNPTAVMEISRDITDRKRAEEVLKETERKWDSLMRFSSDLIMTLDLAGTITYINRGVPGILREEAIGRSIYDFIPPKKHQIHRNAFERVVETGRELSFEIEGTELPGEVAWYENRVVPVEREEQIVGITFFAKNISQRKRAEGALRKSLAELERGRRAALSLMEDANRAKEQIREMSERDPLTDLLNRRAFRDRLTQEWERASRYQQPVSCVLLDLDFFKRINDTHGHAAGDTTLAAIAGLVEDRRRSNDVLCRYGGEEFCVLLPETDEVDAASWAERVRLAISRATISVGDLTLQVTASFGVAERQSNTTGPEELVELADEALAVAKQSGRNRVVRSTSLQETMPAWSQDRPSESPLDNAVARDVMSAIVYCPHQRDAVRTVADLFLQTRINSAPVVDDAGTVVGIVTEADLMTRTAFGTGWEDPMQDVMRTDLVCYKENTPLREVYEFLSRVSVPRLVVVDEGRPTGVISRTTLLRWFRNCAATHEAGSGQRRACSDGERERRRAGIIKAAEAAEERAAHLRRSLANEDNDFVPCFVGEVTRLQSLVSDLLGHCGSGDVP